YRHAPRLATKRRVGSLNAITPQHSAAPRRAVPPALDDHVRVVPLWLPKELLGPAPGIRAPAAPELTYRGGPLIAAAQVFTAFWGQAGNGTDQQNVITTPNECCGC